jgi:hypothetical protein
MVEVEVLMRGSHEGFISSESYDVLYIIQGDMSFSLFKVRLVPTTEPQLHCGCIVELNAKQSRHSMCDAQERKEGDEMVCKHGYGLELHFANRQ